MTHYQCEFEVDKSPEAVFEAITTREGLQAWWTPEAEIDARVGGSARFVFGRTNWTFHIDSLEPNKSTKWTCTQQHIHAPSVLEKTDEWVGTHVIFSIEPRGGGSFMHFEHVGLTENLECFDICRQGWSHFLGNSLKAYLTTGTGMPFSKEQEHG